MDYTIQLLWEKLPECRQAISDRASSHLGHKSRFSGYHPLSNTNPREFHILGYPISEPNLHSPQFEEYRSCQGPGQLVVAQGASSAQSRTKHRFVAVCRDVARSWWNIYRYWLRKPLGFPRSWLWKFLPIHVRCLSQQCQGFRYHRHPANACQVY